MFRDLQRLGDWLEEQEACFVLQAESQRTSSLAALALSRAHVAFAVAPGVPVGKEDSAVARRSQLGFCLALLLFIVALPARPAAADDVVPIEQVQNRVIVREGASSTSREVGSLRPGEQAEYLGQVPSWYHVRLSDGTEGFVPKRWTRVVADAVSSSFTIDVVDVGTGLGILVRGPDFTLVYDAGSNDDLARGDRNRFLAYLRAVAPALTTIDHVILSHPHRDHVELLSDLFQHYQVRHVWDSGAVNPICGYRAFLTAVRDEPGVAYHSAVQDFGTRTVPSDSKQCYGQALPAETLQFSHASRISEFPVALGAGASMTFLHADGSEHDSYNENSLVVRLDLGGTRVLLMGDAEAGGRREPLSLPRPAQLKECSSTAAGLRWPPMSSSWAITAARPRPAPIFSTLSERPFSLFRRDPCVMAPWSCPTRR